MMKFIHLLLRRKLKKEKNQSKTKNLLRKRRRSDLLLKTMSRKLLESTNSNVVEIKLSVKFMALTYLEAILRILQKFLARSVLVVLPQLR